MTFTDMFTKSYQILCETRWARCRGFGIIGALIYAAAPKSCTIPDCWYSNPSIPRHISAWIADWFCGESLSWGWLPARSPAESPIENRRSRQPASSGHDSRLTWRAPPAWQRRARSFQVLTPRLLWRRFRRRCGGFGLGILWRLWGITSLNCCYHSFNSYIYKFIHRYTGHFCLFFKHIKKAWCCNNL